MVESLLEVGVLFLSFPKWSMPQYHCTGVLSTLNILAVAQQLKEFIYFLFFKIQDRPPDLLEL